MDLTDARASSLSLSSRKPSVIPPTMCHADPCVHVSGVGCRGRDGPSVILKPS